MADATAFNLATGIVAVRKMMTTWVNTGTTAAKVWECVGAGVEDSSIEINPDVVTTTDILGVTKTKINKFEKKQSLDPMTLVGGSPLQFKLFEMYKKEQFAEMANWEVMIVYGFVGAAGTYEAEFYSASSIIPQSIGGSAYVDMPIEIQLGGNHTYGTSTTYLPTSTPVYTPAP